MKKFASRKLFILALLLLLLAACANISAQVKNKIQDGKIQAALDQLHPLAESPSKDQLVHLLDYGTALQIAGSYNESNKVFAQAETLAELNDYHSASQVALSAVTNDSAIQYKGESYEKVFINVYKSLNYLMLNQFDEAIVEVRRINEKIKKFRQEERNDYEQNPFANYLGGLIWESAGNYDDAYISYNDSYKIDGSNPFLPADLVRSAKKARRYSEYKSWKAEFPDLQENPDWYNKDKGELIIVIQQGWAPEKIPSPLEDSSLPALRPSRSSTAFAKTKINSMDSIDSTEVYNLSNVAIKTFNDDMKWVIARRVGRAIVKHSIANEIQKEAKGDPFIGLLAYVTLRSLDQADLRQWGTLPNAFQLIRRWLPAGKYTLDLQGVNMYGTPTADALNNTNFTIYPGKKTFLSWRSLR